MYKPTLDINMCKEWWNFKEELTMKKKGNFIKKCCLFLEKKTIFLYFLFLQKFLSLSPAGVFQNGTSKMIGGFMRKEPTNSVRLHGHPKLVAIFTRANWMPFFEKFWGFDEEVAQEFSLSLKPHSKAHATVIFRCLTVEITPEFISRVTSLPLGLP